MTQSNVTELPKKMETASPVEDAQSQADAYDSIFANCVVELDDGTPLVVPPHPDFGLLGDEETEEYEALLFERENTYEREPEIYIPEQRLTDNKGVETGVVLPAETQKGALIRPYCRRNAGGELELVRPAWSVRTAKAALGPEKYALLRSGGRSASDVWRQWTKQAIRSKERQFRRSQADGGSVDLASVPSPDSQ